MKTDNLNNVAFEEYFYYDESSPSCLRWKVDRLFGKGAGHPRVRAGGVAGSLSTTSGYYSVMLKGTLYLVHRIIWRLLRGVLDQGIVVDHIDGVRANNKVENLRSGSITMNARNVKKNHLNKSGVVGVYYREILSKNKTQVCCCWIAAWNERGVKNTKAFSVNKYGEYEAFLLAKKFREDAILRLNEQGAGYSKRHGT